MVFAGITVLPADAASPSTYAVRGVDTSHHNHSGGKPIDWNQVRSSGQDFAFVKATEGADWQDPWFTRDLRGVRQAGLPHGPYHFYGRTPGADQARNFVSTVKAAGYTGKAAGELPPVLDLEQQQGRCPANFGTADVRAFLTTVTSQLGVKPIVYTTKSFVDACMGGDGSVLAGHVMWQPRYKSGSNEPAPVPGAGQELEDLAVRGDRERAGHPVRRPRRPERLPRIARRATPACTSGRIRGPGHHLPDVSTASCSDTGHRSAGADRAEPRHRRRHRTAAPECCGGAPGRRRHLRPCHGGSGEVVPDRPRP